MGTRLRIAVILAVVALAIRAPGSSAQATSSKPSVAASPAIAATSLADARATLGKASKAGLPAALEAAIAALPIDEAIGLVDEYLQALAAPDRSRFLVETAGLSLLVGGFADAADRYERASALSDGGRDATLLLKAGRCALAAGDVEKTTELSALVLAAGADPAGIAGARLLGAWALAFRGRSSDALGVASALLAPASGAAAAGGLAPELRREARFLLWLCSSAEGKPAAAAALAAEFPGSPEALVAAGSASTPPLPHWYLGELGTLKGRAPASLSPASGAPARPAASSPAAQAKSTVPDAPSPAGSAQTPKASAASSPAASAASAESGARSDASSSPAAPTEGLGRLQVGYFSVEANATRLAAQLKAKGFSALVEARTRTPGSSAPSDRRWIVLVEAGADPLATMKSLKDAGYESYGVE